MSNVWCRYGESPAAPLMASLQAYEQAIQEGAAPSPLPLYMEHQPPFKHLEQCVLTLSPNTQNSKELPAKSADLHTVTLIVSVQIRDALSQTPCKGHGIASIVSALRPCITGGV